MIDQGRIPEEFLVVKERYPGLHLVENEASWNIVGVLHFRGVNNSVEIEDKYSVEIQIPTDYPDELPVAREVEGRISKDFHTSYDGTLCLGPELRVRIRFYQNPTLLGFVEDFLADYLYGYSYKLKFGKLPFGEYSHSVPGIIEHYKELFETESIGTIVGLLTILARENYRGHHPCPCGSEERLRICHGMKLRNLMKYWTPKGFAGDLNEIVSFMRSQ